MNILITGANGQLGSELKALESNYSHFKFVYGDLPELDICNKALVNDFVKTNNIEAIINGAAYTAVDKAETDEVLAERVNSLGVENLVEAMQAVNGKIIHISTDYVFDGTNHTPYIEEDIVNPLGVYGKTKLMGEQKLLVSTVNGIIIRTSWLYSAYGANFVKTMLRLGSERQELNVVFDQIGTPTYAGDLAKAILNILSKYPKLNAKGKIYHFSNEGVASWYDFAKAIMELGGFNCKINSIETKDYPTPAKRPMYSILNKSKVKADFNIKIPYWRDSLKDSMVILKNL